MEGDIRAATAATLIFRFLSTPSGWRATPKCKKNRKHRCISIHALRVEGDPRSGAERRGRWITFLSTPSGWRATAKAKDQDHHPDHFYPRPPGGGRRRLCDRQFLIFQFLSTPSGWRATNTALRLSEPVEFLSTPSGWRATVGLVKRAHNVKISIHALRVEGDEIMRYAFRAQIIFLSTPSGWRATLFGLNVWCKYKISIHALRVEGDRRTRRTCSRCRDFYPRPPGGGRRFWVCRTFVCVQFLSTPSGWRATSKMYEKSNAPL